MKIKLLDASVANKIAAGEVVERPASIVKELVENSIDAGATNVTVEIRGGGIDYIRITDNGCGMAEEDVKNAFLRHATSKISVAEDLDGIVTLGFRGEALASVAAVSNVELVTRTKDSDEGTEIQLSGGNIERFFPCGCAEGTSITVKDLFFNTPARRKFLKKPSQEASYIQEAVNRLALSNPQIALRFVSDGKTLVRTPGDSQLLSCIRAIFGQEVSSNMIPVDKTVNGIRLSGFLGKREIQRSNRSRQILFINGRSIKNDMISSAIHEAYAGRLNIGKFPFFVIEMTVDTTLVDVNVHPTKQEVRFMDGLPVYATVYNIVNETLLKNQEIPSLFKTEEKKEEVKIFEVEAVEPKKAAEVRQEEIFFTAPTPVNENAAEITRMAQAFKPAEFGVMDTPFSPVSLFKAEEPETVKEPVIKEERKIEEQPVFLDESVTEYKICGVLFDTYIIIEAEDEGYIIDQHAAHERLLFEKLYKEMEDGAPGQLLLMPQIVKVSPQESVILEELLPRLREMGFEIDDMGFGSFGIKAVPAAIDNCDGERFITSILDESASLKSLRTNELKRNKLMQMACKGAVKGGDKLSDGEIKTLLTLIKKEGIPLSCPHGRPILIRLTKHELEVRFKRVQ